MKLPKEWLHLIVSMRDGNIRIMAESPGIDLTSVVEPTKEQYSALRKFINTNGSAEGQFFVDFSGTEGERVGNYSYNGRIIADRIINDINFLPKTEKCGSLQDCLISFLYPQKANSPEPSATTTFPARTLLWKLPLLRMLHPCESPCKKLFPPVTEETELFPDTPVAQSAVSKLEQLNQQKEALEGRMLEAVGAEDYDTFYQLNNEYEALMQEIEALDQEVAAEDADRINSLTEADIPPETEANIPPEMDAPYYGDNQTNKVDDPFEDRDWYEVGNRKVKAYMYENPEVKPFFQEEAMNLLGELNATTRGERWYNDKLYYESGGEAGFGGVKRHTSASMEELLDSWGMSYADIEKGLNAIIEDHGAENIAAAKKLEFMLNDRLLNGYKDFYSNGRIPPNQDYINLLNEKQITEYSKESFDALMANADQYSPAVADDIAPTPDQSVSTETALGNRVLERTADLSLRKTNLKHAIRNKALMLRHLRHSVKTQAASRQCLKVRRKRTKQSVKIRLKKQAQILTEEPKVVNKKTSAWNLFKDNFVDKGTVFETMSLKTGNRELQAKWKAIGRAESSAQWFMENGNSSTSSLKSIRDTVEKSGKTKQFYEYLYRIM